MSLSITHWWLIANTALLLLLTLALAGLWLKYRSTVQSLEAAMSLLKQSQHALTNTTVGMGQRLKQITGKVQFAQNSVNVDENKLAQATRLVRLGASASDLVDHCGVPRAEAELLVSIQKSQHSSTLS